MLRDEFSIFMGQHAGEHQHMVVLVIAAILFGAVLGRYLTVFSLLPSCLLSILLALSVEPASTFDTAMRVATLLASMQLGYLIGLVFNKVAAARRAPHDFPVLLLERKLPMQNRRGEAASISADCEVHSAEETLSCSTSIQERCAHELSDIPIPFPCSDLRGEGPQRRDLSLLRRHRDDNDPSCPIHPGP